jgi:hypothetical protein
VAKVWGRAGKMQDRRRRSRAPHLTAKTPMTTAHSQPARFGSGKSVRRVEDDALLTGRDQFADNFSLPRQTHLVLVRSPHAMRGSPGSMSPWRRACRRRRRARGGLRRGWREADSRSRPSGRTARLRHRRRSACWRSGPCATWARRWSRSSPNAAQARDAADAVDIRYAPLPAVADLADAVLTGAAGVTGRGAHRMRSGTATAGHRARDRAAASSRSTSSTSGSRRRRSSRATSRTSTRHRPRDDAGQLPDAHRTARRARQRRAGHPAESIACSWATSAAASA